MERLKELNRYQKGVLLLLLSMIMVFGVIYALTTSRTGFLYNEKIFIPSEVNGNLVYSGTIRGQECSFLVTSDKTVIFHCGDKVYGPYTATEDPTAIPDNDPFYTNMTGVEVRKGNDVIFRGGVFLIGGTDSHWMLINEDGSANFTVTAVMNDGTVIDGEGNEIDEMEPSVSDILHLMHGPELTQKGDWFAWFCGIFISIMTAVDIIFEDVLFRWHLSFRIRDVDRAEPSDWEIANRYISWTALTVAALVIYIMGLQ